MHKTVSFLEKNLHAVFDAMNDLVGLFRGKVDSMGDFDGGEAVSCSHHNDFPLTCGTAEEEKPPVAKWEDRLGLFLRVHRAVCCYSFVPDALFRNQGLDDPPPQMLRKAAFADSNFP